MAQGNAMNTQRADSSRPEPDYISGDAAPAPRIRVIGIVGAGAMGGRESRRWPPPPAMMCFCSIKGRALPNRPASRSASG